MHEPFCLGPCERESQLLKSRTLILISSVIAALTVTACVTLVQPAPVQPTQAAPAQSTPADALAAEDTAAAPETAVEAETPAQDSLIANPWQWVSFTSPVEQFDVEMPESYLLTFADDGTVAVQADCNQASGEYVADSDETLRITLGPVTTAACPEGSRGEDFLRYLAAATSFTYEGEQLEILLNPDSGASVLVFEPAA